MQNNLIILYRFLVLISSLAFSIFVGVVSYTFIYYVTMPIDYQTKNLEFYLSDGQNPHLQSTIAVGTLTKPQNDQINMEKETYNIELKLSVIQDSKTDQYQNRDHTNIFMTSTLVSYKG